MSDPDEVLWFMCGVNIGWASAWLVAGDSVDAIGSLGLALLFGILAKIARRKED